MRSCDVPLGMAHRRRQVISSLSGRRDVVRWIMFRLQETGSDHPVPATAVAQFPRIFTNRSNCPKTRSAHRRKASQWWRNRYSIIEKLTTIENSRLFISSTNSFGVGRKKFDVKSFYGRGRKCENLEFSLSTNF